MKWSSAISSAPVIEDAISECVLRVKTDIGDDEINFACLYRLTIQVHMKISQV